MISLRNNVEESTMVGKQQPSHLFKYVTLAVLAIRLYKTFTHSIIKNALAKELIMLRQTMEQDPFVLDSLYYLCHCVYVYLCLGIVAILFGTKGLNMALLFDRNSSHNSYLLHDVANALLKGLH